jgi:hypothetical protein
MRFALSSPAYHRNCTQEAGSLPDCASVSMHSMASPFPESRVVARPISLAGWLLMLMLLVLEWLAGRASARAAVVVAPHVTLVVFADQPLADPQWTALTSTLRSSFDTLAVESHFSAVGFEVVRGDTLAPGTQFDEVISIYLHGDCQLHSQPGPYTVRGALGWVLSDHGQIRPFIHVDCARIDQVLGQRTFGMDKNARSALISEAISRVIFHEWLHIATQASSHTREGISKRSFSFEDLVPEYAHARGFASRGK